MKGLAHTRRLEQDKAQLLLQRRWLNLGYAVNCLLYCNGATVTLSHLHLTI